MSGLELRDVVKHFPASEVVRAIDGVTLAVAPGELVALYGPSGAGKTTLLLLAAGVVVPDAGSVRYDGQDLAALSATERTLHQRRRVGFVYQQDHLVAGVPAVDNAAVKLLADGVRLHDARRRTIPWLERVGLGARLDHTPAQLSGGERQRVAIARALVNEPRLILADEPTASLDSRRGGEILALFASICREQGVAALLATHDARAAMIADRVHELRDGTLQALGPAPDAGGSRAAPAGAWSEPR